MPVKTFGYDLVQNVRVQVVPPDNEPQEVCIHNHEHSSSKEIFLGNETVTVDNGSCSCHSDFDNYPPAWRWTLGNNR